MSRFLCVLCSMVVLIVSACENKSAAVITQPDNVSVQSSAIAKPSLFSVIEQNFDETSPKPDIEEIRRLIKDGTDVNEVDKEGKTFLMSVVKHNQSGDVVQYLIDSGANVNAKDNIGKTALMYAAENNRNPDILRVLLQNGADITARDKEGRTALLWASQGTSQYDDKPINPEIFKVLIDAGRGKTVNTPNGKVPFIDVPGYSDHTVLMDVIMRNNGEGKQGIPKEVWKILRILIRENPNLEARTSYDGGCTVLMDAVSFTYEPKIIYFLVKHGANINATSESGETALMIAARRDWPGDVIVRALLKNGADLDMKDDGGKTAEDHARSRERDMNIIVMEEFRQSRKK